MANNRITISSNEINNYEELNLFILYKEIENKKVLQKYLNTKVLLNKETNELYYKINISHSNINTLNVKNEYVKLNIETIEKRFSNIDSIEAIEKMIYLEKDRNILEYLAKSPDFYLYSDKELMENTMYKNPILLNVIIGDTPTSNIFNYETALDKTGIRVYLNETLPELFYKKQSILFKGVNETLDLMQLKFLKDEKIKFALNIEAYEENETGLDDFIYSIASKIDSIYYPMLSELKGDKIKLVEKFDSINKEIIEYVNSFKEKIINFNDICRRYIEERGELELLKKDNYLNIVTNEILKNYFSQEFYREKLGVSFEHLFENEIESSDVEVDTEEIDAQVEINGIGD